MTPVKRRPAAEAPTDEKVLAAIVEMAKREAVEKVLKQAGGNVTRAADKLGILRTSLYRIMNRYGIAPPTGYRRDGRATHRTTGKGT